MSFVSKESIKVAAEAVGLNDLGDEVAAALAPDVEYRLREIIQEALKFRRHSKRHRMTTSDISRALRVRNVEAIFGYSFTDPLVFRRAEGTSDVFHVEDRELDFDEIINAALPRCPVEVSMSSHWLAIEGVQPSIPENPPPLEETADSDRIMAGLSEPPAGKVVGEVLSQELQVLYAKVTQVVLKGPDVVRDAALLTLTRDAGLQPLLPYLAQFINDEVTRNLRNLNILFALMRMVRCLLASPHLHIEPYLHQLMPPLLTCLVGKRLCASPLENHWHLRDFSASLLSSVVATYHTTYSSLLPRTTRTLLHALLDPSKPLVTHYGAVVGLTALGPRTVASLLLPNIGTYFALLQKELASTNIRKREEAGRVHGAILRAAGGLLYAFPDDFAGLNTEVTAASVPIPNFSDSFPAVNGNAGAASNGITPSHTPAAFKWRKPFPPQSRSDDMSDETGEQQQQRKEEKSARGCVTPAGKRYAEMYETFGSSLTPFHVGVDLTGAVL